MKRINSIYLVLVLTVLSCSTPIKKYRESINLEGKWQFALDTASVGVQQKWYLTGLNDSVNLPGTTDSNHKGFRNTDTTTLHLNRLYKYEGAAWYRKKVMIPQSFKDKHIQLFLERTKSTRIWVDSNFVGGSHILQSPQQFDVTDYLTPGEHYLTIRVDNSLKLTPYGNVHIYSDDTQTNWNGIIGQIKLVASSKTYISNLQVYPDIEHKKIAVRINIENGLDLKNIDVKLLVNKTQDGKTTTLRSQSYSLKYDSLIQLEYKLGDACSLWDEFHQPLYHLTAVISGDNCKDAKTVVFGMRKFSVRGTQFAINGRTTFLRGKHEACVFPLTGYPPTDVKDWMRVFRIAKSYGINHYRFHSYCPPEAAFTAADQLGIYLQAELPFWGDLNTDSVATMLRKEGFDMLKAYANHPSFVMFSHGNEIWGGLDRVEKNIKAFKKYDDRPLYTTGSNNGIGYIPPPACSDYFIGARTPYAHDTILTHTRLSQAFVDSRDGGMINTQTPSTEVAYNYAVSHMHIPIIGHEVGQYQIYPDYREIGKYTGVLRAWNLDVFRDRLKKAGMLDQDMAFHKASGAWAALCYKAEIEAAIRTKGFAGFQLLDLQDYPGQGTALVGILDAFMDSKNVVSRKTWLQSCNDVVLLLEFPKYCWTNQEHFQAKAVVANYSDHSIDKGLNWEVKDQNGTVIRKGAFTGTTINDGGLTTIGQLNVDLSPIRKPEKLMVNIFVSDHSFSNSYPIWVYPPATAVPVSKDILVATKLDNAVFTRLQKGGKVLLFPSTDEVKGKSVPGLFPPDFWNYEMFKGISKWAKKPVSPGTLGLLMDPKHPIFNSFPTDFHTNWQWFSIIKASNSLILDDTPHSYRPIVQVIDNLQRDHKMGLIFEFKVGKGKLLVCMSQLNKIMDKPEAAQLYRSIIGYMGSDNFNPAYTITANRLKSLL